MRPLDTADLLQAWERGLALPPAERALLLLAAAEPDTPPELLARRSVGQRDAGLLRLREWAFGPAMDCVGACPACGEQLELALSTADLRLSAPEPPDLIRLEVGGYEICARVPCAGDLLALERCGEHHTARRRLLACCLLDVRCSDAAVPIDELPPEVLGAVAERMADADPLALLQVALTCPQCGHCWEPIVDIVPFFWSEIASWANRLLRDVHLLASAYGWCEAEILALSPARRQAYLDMVSE